MVGGVCREVEVGVVVLKLPGQLCRRPWHWRVKLVALTRRTAPRQLTSQQRHSDLLVMDTLEERSLLSHAPRELFFLQGPEPPSWPHSSSPSHIYLYSLSLSYFRNLTTPCFCRFHLPYALAHLPLMLTYGWRSTIAARVFLY